MGFQLVASLGYLFNWIPTNTLKPQKFPEYFFATHPSNQESESNVL
jgi:hypothetical protein